MIAARRPNSPLLSAERRVAAASAAPSMAAAAKPLEIPAIVPGARKGSNPPPRRAARIVALPKNDVDEQARLRERLLDRLLTCEGRGAISRAATEYQRAGFSFPEEQAVQLQLLEHFDEECARDSLEALARLLAAEPPLKRPVLEQRLRRLEEYADEPATRDAAAALRKRLRA